MALRIRHRYAKSREIRNERRLARELHLGLSAGEHLHCALQSSRRSSGDFGRIAPGRNRCRAFFEILGQPVEGGVREDRLANEGLYRQRTAEQSEEFYGRLRDSLERLGGLVARILELAAGFIGLVAGVLEGFVDLAHALVVVALVQPELNNERVDYRRHYSSLMTIPL